VPWLPSGDVFSYERLLTIPTIPELEHDRFVLIDLSRVPVCWGSLHGVQAAEDDESGETQQSFGFHDNTSELLQFLLASSAAQWSPGLVLCICSSWRGARSLSRSLDMVAISVVHAIP
jgi:hypothetical protein